MHWNLINDAEFGFFIFLKLKYGRVDQIIQPFCRIGCPQEIRCPLLNLRKFWKSEKKTDESCRMHWNLLNGIESGSFKFLKLKYRRKDQLIQPFCTIGSPKEIRSPLLNLRNFWKSEKRTAEGCRINWNLRSDQEFESFKFLKLKYCSWNQIILLFCRIGSPNKLGSPSWIWGNFENVRKELFSHVECIEI